MFAIHFVFWALLAISGGQEGIPQYIQDEWIVTENPQYDDMNGQFLAVEETVAAEGSSEGPRMGPFKDQNSSVTPESLPVKGQEAAESLVWKIVLVVAILLVSIVGSLSMAYYLCVWRGGRIYYQAQKEVYA